MSQYSVILADLGTIKEDPNLHLHTKKKYSGLLLKFWKNISPSICSINDSSPNVICIFKKSHHKNSNKTCSGDLSTTCKKIKSLKADFLFHFIVCCEMLRTIVSYNEKQSGSAK